MKAIAPEWGIAEVASILTASDFNNEHEYAVFALKANTETIFSLDPAQDYEVNPHTIDGWRMIFFDEFGDTIGDADYFTAIAALKAYAIDQNSNSLLIKKLTSQELKQILQDANGSKTIQLTF